MVDERGTELAWYENPTWERHVLIKDVPRTINLDVYDYDGCGIPEIAMGHNFETVPEGWNLSTLPCVQTPGSNSHLIARTATHTPTATHSICGTSVHCPLAAP